MSIQQPTYRNGDVVLVLSDGVRRPTVFFSVNPFDDSVADVIFAPLKNYSVIEAVSKALLVERIGSFPPDVMQILNVYFKRSTDRDEDDNLSSAGVPRRPYPHAPETNDSLDLPNNQDPYAENNSK